MDKPYISGQFEINRYFTSVRHRMCPFFLSIADEMIYLQPLDKQTA